MMKINFKHMGFFNIISFVLLYKTMWVRKWFSSIRLFMVLAIVFPATGDDNFHYPGVISIKTPFSRGTGFFYSQSNIVVTAFHVIIPRNDRKRTKKSTRGVSLKDYISLHQSPMGDPIPVTNIEIIALDGKYDIAVLKIEGFHSDSFYPTHPILETEHCIESCKIKSPGFPALPASKSPSLSLSGKLVVLDGITAGDSNYDYPGSRSFIGFVRDDIGCYRNGMSGSPVLLSSDNSVLGIYIEGIHTTLVGPIGWDIFVSVNKLRALLKNPSLSCFDFSCIKKEILNLRKQALSGDRQSLYRLGTVIPPFSDERVRQLWFEKAARKGHPHAQFLLGNAQFGLDNLEYMEKKTKYLSPKADKYWLEKSASQDHLPAKIFLERIRSQKPQPIEEFLKKPKVCR